MIAIVGGDGAGKSTAVEALSAWLAKNFQTTTLHMGKPAWSWTTKLVRGVLKIGQVVGLYPLEVTFRETINQESRLSPGYPWLVREVCRARDRYGAYVKARRFANRGGLVILDRFPVPEIQIMDGLLTRLFIEQLMAGPRADQFLSPRPDDRLAQLLVKHEESYYYQITPPELLIVIRVDPETAVQRKTDEDAAAVRERSTKIWNLDWAHTQAHVIDGSQSKTEVLTKLKALIWSQL
jgi:thymidylate kinase